MNEQLEAVCRALDALGGAITSGWSGDQTFCEAWGWNCPAVTRHDAAAIATSLAAEIREADIQEIDEETSEFLGDLPRTLKVVQTQTVPQFWNGNNGAAYAAYLGTISSIRASLHPLLGWKTIPDPKTLPGHTVRRLKSIQAEVEALAPNKDQLQKQLQEIAQAHTVAENLPLDLKALADARQKVVSHADAAEAAAKRIDVATEASNEDVRKTKINAEEAAKLVAQCEEAYRITTTKGLAAAFDQRATRLGWAVSIWVVGLVAALAFGSYLGAQRLEALTQVLAAPSINWASILLHAILSFLSIGAPIWFAWLATKQIGQRFRLAEDYAYKASVAKAYEGYRREAARIDPEFEARLFASALTRLEEAPLRLVDTTTHGSPWHEALSSSPVQKTIDAVPELRDRALSLAADAVSFLKRRKASVEPPKE
ncbi:MAG: hypothetical protein RL297_2022 [Pseudomonadota bacterium]|jgi:hypothetical protein